MKKDLSEEEKELVKTWRDVPSDLITTALNESILYHANSLNYTDNIIKRLLKEQSNSATSEKGQQTIESSSAMNEEEINENSSAMSSKELFDYNWLEGDES